MIERGVYKIENLVNGKIYIGSSTEIPIRRYNHFNRLQRNVHPNPHLQAAYNKYGKEVLKFEILEEVNDLNQLIHREQYWMDLAQKNNQQLYNLTLIADRSNNILTLEAKQKISQTLKRKGIKPPSRKNIGYGFCKLYCPKGHYKTSKSLIHGSNACKECQRIKSQNWRVVHK